MLSENNASRSKTPKREGDLYRVVTTFGKNFELRYGYYDEKDRQSDLCEPAVIYPDFVKHPTFTKEGEPFVTLMQDACDHYKGSTIRTQDTVCADCNYLGRGEEWFGICTCAKNRKNE